MGYISGFGIVPAAPIAALAVLAVLAVSAGTSIAATPAAKGVSIDVTLVGLRSTKGLLLVCLTADPKAYPDCGLDHTAHKIKIPATSAQSIRFTDVTPGTYLMTVLHDENGNGKLDLLFGIPREGFGFSQNPKIRFSAPKVAEVQFVVGTENSAQSIKMKYVF